MWGGSTLASISHPLHPGLWLLVQPLAWLGFTPVMVVAPDQALTSTSTLILALIYFNL